MALAVRNTLHTWKRRSKRGLQVVCCSLGRHRWPVPWPRLVVLGYHRILPEQHPDARIMQPGMVVRPQTFEMHIRLLKSHFAIVHLADWLSKARLGSPLPAKACAITFDDGWADNFRYAFPILRQENVPATIFLVSDMIGTRQSFWPERLSRMLHYQHNAISPFLSAPAFRWLTKLDDITEIVRRGPSQEDVDRIITRAKVYSDDDLCDKLTEMEDELGTVTAPCEQDILSWEQVEDMIDSGLIEIGSHTKTHKRLTSALSPETARAEIIMSKDYLEKRLKRPLHLFCYPNGDWIPEAKQTVQEHYLGALTTVPGWNSPQSDFYTLKRIGIHEDISREKLTFLARLSGWI
jgi:peptidoglycan/xylan/chitin deacetylase (PgdA/CDA1 family)